MKTAFIYGLRCPLTGQIRYIGKAANPKKRLSVHLASKERCHRTNWIQSLTKQHVIPVLEIIAEVPETDWQFWERSYIRLYRGLGFDLVNSTDGGEGSLMFGEKNPMFGRLGEAHPMFGKKHSSETCAKMSAAHKGRKLSPETCAKMSEARRGEKNHNFGKRGKKHSSASREKISRAQLGRKHNNNTSGFVGISRCRDKWQPKIQGKSLGCFLKIEDAVFVRALTLGIK